MTTADPVETPSDWLGELSETVEIVTTALEQLVREGEELRERADSWNRQLGEARRELVRLEDHRRGDRQRTLRLRKVEEERNALRDRLERLMGSLEAVAGASDAPDPESTEESPE